MMALMAAAVTIGALSQIYLADYLIYPMRWIDMVVYDIGVMITSLMYLVGLNSGDVFPARQMLTGQVGVGLFGAGLYIASEIFYVISILVFATRQAVRDSAGSPESKYHKPKKLIISYMLINVLYTVSFFYYGMFSIGLFMDYGMAFSAIMDADSLEKFIVFSWPWKLLFFVPFQLVILGALWKDKVWVKTALSVYLLLDFFYYMALTLIPEQGYRLISGLIISTMALLIFLPYLRRKQA